MLDLPDDTPFGIRKAFITEQEREALYQWSAKQLNDHHLKFNGRDRYYNQYKNLPEVPEEFFAIRERIGREIGRDDVLEEPHISCYLSTIGKGGAVHFHRDATRTGYNHLRFNVVVSKAEGGGRPIIGKTPLEVEERDMWYFFANKHRHGSEAVSGGKRRVICSYGFLVPGNTKATLFDFLINNIGGSLRGVMHKMTAR